MTRPLICLATIVKDEEKIIGRCLANMRRYIDRWIVVDTGSTDKTIAEVRKAMEGVSGQLHERPWRGFGDAKTATLCLARELMNGEGYAFVVDADEIIQGDLPEDLTCDSYSVWMHLNNVRYTNTRLFRLDKDWRYEGVLHEFPISAQAKTQGALDLIITTPRDGARGKDPKRYQNDAEVLEAEIARMGPTKDPAECALKTRYMFYLAQSYRDAKLDVKALVAYLKRADMGPGMNWEEVYVSLLNAGRCLHRMGNSTESQKVLLRAHQAWPERVEALRDLQASLVPKLRIAEAKKPVGTLFVET